MSARCSCLDERKALERKHLDPLFVEIQRVCMIPFGEVLVGNKYLSKGVHAKLVGYVFIFLDFK